jgi:ubiquinol-cytochrome c reductase iron-sulfur subunit
MVDATHQGAGMTGGHGGDAEGKTRRDFIYLAAGAMGAVASAGVAWTLVDSMNPAADTLALSTIDVNLAPIAEGMGIVTMWQGKPVFVRHRTAKEIADSEAVKVSDLIDPVTEDPKTGAGALPATDANRVQKSPWLVLIGICTHLGCIPLGNKPTDDRGAWGGYHCPCHGSEYDTAGRVRRGPAPLNLHIPPYAFTSDTAVRIG